MGLMKKIYDINKQTVKNLSPMGTGGGGNIMLDLVMTKATQDFVDEGRKQGYEQASNEYEKKLINQADEFIKQKKVFEAERDAYEKLLEEYEDEIQKLISKQKLTEEENEYLKELLLRERKLRKLYWYRMMKFNNIDINKYVSNEKIVIF